MFVRDCDRDQLGAAVDHSIPGLDLSKFISDSFRVERQTQMTAGCFKDVQHFALSQLVDPFLVDGSERNGLIIIDFPYRDLNGAQ